MGVDGNEIKTSEFVGIFSDDKCEGLRGKPKFFFIQVNVTIWILSFIADNLDICCCCSICMWYVNFSFFLTY